MSRRNGKDNRRRAVCRKWKAISWEERGKLLAKLALRAVGVKKPLFLGGYYWEEDDRQRKWDLEIYLRLEWAKTDETIAEYNRGLHRRNLAEETIEDSSCTQMVSEGKAKEQMLEILKERGSYLALAVESLDKGGLEEVVRLLTMELHQDAIPMKLFCIQAGGEIAEELRAEGIEVLNFEGSRAALEQYCRENPPLLVNSHYVSEALEVFRQLEIPVVEVIHNMYVFLDREGMLREQNKIPYISQYIAVSEKAKEIYLGKFPALSPDKITVIGNRFDSLKTAGKSRETIRASWGIDEDAFVYIVVGSIDARKNQIGIVRALDIVSRMTDEKVVLVLAGGSTDNEYERKLHQLADERMLNQNIIFTGHTREIPDLLNAADAFVLDSYYEGWSVAATEALSCGLPLIHADCGSGRELIAGGQNGILIENPLNALAEYDSITLYDVMHAGINENTENLVVAMLSLLEQRSEWRAKRETIQNYAAEHFSTPAVLEQYLEIFIQTLKNGAKADE